MPEDEPVDYKRMPIMFKRDNTLSNLMGDRAATLGSRLVDKERTVPVIFEYPNGNLTIASPVGYRLGAEKPMRKRTHRSAAPVAVPAPPPEEEEDHLEANVIGETSHADTVSVSSDDDDDGGLPSGPITLIGDRAHGPFEQAEQRKMALAVYGFALCDIGLMFSLWAFYRIAELPNIEDAERPMTSTRAPMIVQVIGATASYGFALSGAWLRSDFLLSVFIGLMPAIYLMSVARMHMFGYSFHFLVSLAAWLAARSMRDRLAPQFINTVNK